MEKAILAAVSFAAGLAIGSWIATVVIAQMLMAAPITPAASHAEAAPLTAQQCLQACDNVQLQTTAPASVLETATSVTQ